MRELKLSTDTFDQENTFAVSHIKYATCSLHRDYKVNGDGIYWVMQKAGMLKSHYSDQDRAESERIMADKGISNGDVVLIDGNEYKFKYLGNYSDCGYFEPVTE